MANCGDGVSLPKPTAMPDDSIESVLTLGDWHSMWRLMPSFIAAATS